MRKTSAPPRLAIVYRSLSDLLPAKRNPRTHSDAQVAQIAASIREFGFTNPLLVDEASGIIAGHGRLAAARLAGLDSVPCIVIPNLSAAQKRALLIADNRLALSAGWDEAMLAEELASLQADEFDLSLLGFDADELAALMDRSEGLTDPDDAPEPPANPVSRLGDVWVMGKHRLVCGDCTSAPVVSSLLGKARPHLMVTDPPYGVNYDADWRNHALRADGSKFGGRAIGKVTNDAQADWRAAYLLAPCSVAYVWHADMHVSAVAASLESCRFQIRAQIIWVKTRAVLSHGDYHGQHEPVFYAVQDGADDHWHFVPEHEVSVYAVKKGAVGQYRGGRKQSTVWFIEHIKSETGHSTQKPVECMRRPIENNSKAGEGVYDPFVDSGTTLIAAEMTARVCYGVEIAPAYVDVCVLRWQAFTGRAAVLEKDGRSFDVVSSERVPEAA